MEENLPAKKPEGQLPTLNTSQGLILASQTKIGSAANTEILSAIQYVMALMGTPKEKQPSVVEMTLIIGYLKIYLKSVHVDEIRIAFDLAIQKRFPANLELYGGTLSVNYILGVLNAYLQYKKKLLKDVQEQKAEHMNNYDRARGVLEIISKKPEMLEKLKEIGAEDKSKIQLPELPYHDVHQKWMRQFDKLRIKYEVANGFIKRYGYIMNVEGYFNKKAEQLQLAKERNKDLL